MSEQATPAPLNCPFYGRHVGLLESSCATRYPLTLLLLDAGGNQCGLETDRFAPCELKVSGRPIEWQGCPVVVAHTVFFPRP